MMKRAGAGLMLGSSLFAIVGIFAATPALAQDAQNKAPQAAAEEATSSGDIVVTARRKSEKLIDVPSSITVVSVEMMKAKGITNPTDLVHAVPSLQQSSSGFGNSTPHFLIRGQRQQLEFIQNDQSVGVYIDEIAVPRQQGLNAGLFDMAGVQVLKGPQGTLFGKNQTGGAILFSSQTPTSDFGGYFSTTIGNYDARKLEAAINIPITDDLQIRAAGMINRRDGYMHNVTDGRDYNDQHTDAWRVSAHYAPAGAPVENWLIVAGAVQNEIGAMSKFLPERIGIPGVGVSAIFGAFGNAFGDAFNTAALQSQAKALGPWEVAGVSQFQLPNGNNVEISNFSVTNKTEFHLGDNTTLRNIFGYRFLRSYQSANMSGTAGFLLAPNTNPFNPTAANPNGFTEARLLYPAVGGVPVPAGNVVCGPQSGVDCVLGGAFMLANYTKQRQISEELSILGTAFDGRLDYILGGYYFRESGDVLTTNFTPISIGSRMGTAQNSPVNESKAIFGQATFKVTPTVSITGGLRQTWDKRETNASSVTIVPNYWPLEGFKSLLPADGVLATCALVGDGGTLPNTPGGCLLSASANFNKLTYTASIDWKPTPDMLVYAATRKGYRSGGFNQSATVNTTAAPTVLTPFNPETVTDYEIGFKGNWRWGNGMAAGLNGSYYYNNYNDIQRALTARAGNKSVTANAATAKIEGVEVEARFEPTPWLELTGYYSRIRARFKSFVVTDAVLYNNSSLGDFTKSAFSGVPTDSGGATIRLHSELPGDKGRISASMDYYGQTGTYMQDTNFDAVTQSFKPDDYIPGYWLLGANVSWTDVMGKPIDLNFNIRNINNKRYGTGGVNAISSGLGTLVYFLGEPRMYTVSAKVRF